MRWPVASHLARAIALRLAVHYPERVSELIIARPAWISEAAPERLRIYLDVAELLAQYGSEQGLHAPSGYRAISVGDEGISGQCGVDAGLLSLVNPHPPWRFSVEFQRRDRSDSGTNVSTCTADAGYRQRGRLCALDCDGDHSGRVDPRSEA